MIFKERFISKAMASTFGNDRGAALVAALLFLMFSAMIGATAILLTAGDLRIGKNYRDNTQTHYIAEAGLSKAEAELKNDLNTDGDFTNTNFNTISGTVLSITPDSSAFYDVFSNVAFGSGSFTIQFKNYGTSPDFDITRILLKSIGTGTNSSSVTIESSLLLENVSPWNNAIFSDGGGGSPPITGNVDIAGSIHLLGTGLPATATVINIQTVDCLNDNSGMDPILANDIAGGTSTDLNAKFRVKNGRVDMSVGSGKIGSSASPYKNILVTSGTDGGNGVNADIIGGDNAGAGRNLYADKGALSPKAYDLGSGVPMPTIDTVWLNANSLDLTAITESDGAPTPKGLIAGALELKGGYSIGPTWYYPDINQTDGTNSISFDSSSCILSISGIIKVLSLTISDDITYSGQGTIYITGSTSIDGDVLPDSPATYPTVNVLGIISTGNITLPTSADKLLTGAYYSAATVTSSKQNELAGTIVCSDFNITNQVPKIWQVPSLAQNLPPGMPGKDPIWVITEKTWRDLSL